MQLLKNLEVMTNQLMLFFGFSTALLGEKHYSAKIGQKLNLFQKFFRSIFNNKKSLDSGETKSRF